LDRLVALIPPVQGKAGRPRRRPDALYGDRAYDSRAHRDSLWALGIRPFLARKGEAHGSGLGAIRWVVERTLSWLHQNRRLRVRYERRADIHDGFLKLACAMICFKHLASAFCQTLLARLCTSISAYFSYANRISLSARNDDGPSDRPSRPRA
jgi:transposase